MKRHIVMLGTMIVAGCLLGVLVSKEEAVVDGLAQNNNYLIMEKANSSELEWTSAENVWMTPVSETYVPVQGIPKDAEIAQRNKCIISTLQTVIEETFAKYNPGLWYRIDSA